MFLNVVAPKIGNAFVFQSWRGFLMHSVCLLFCQIVNNSVILYFCYSYFELISISTHYKLYPHYRTVGNLIVLIVESGMDCVSW